MAATAPPENPPREETLIKGVNPFSGAVLDNISPSLIEEMGGLDTESGVVIYKVEGGIAARIGLQQGDIPLTLNGEKITSVGQLKKMLQPGATRWQIQIRRGERVISMTVSG